MADSKENQEKVRREKAERVAKDKQNTKNATGKGDKPGVGSKKWAKDNGL